MDEAAALPGSSPASWMNASVLIKHHLTNDSRQTNSGWPCRSAPGVSATDASQLRPFHKLALSSWNRTPLPSVRSTTPRDEASESAISTPRPRSPSVQRSAHEVHKKGRFIKAGSSPAPLLDPRAAGQDAPSVTLESAALKAHSSNCALFPFRRPTSEHSPGGAASHRDCA